VNAQAFAEVLARQDEDGQQGLPLVAEGVQRFVWDSRFGPILIEIIGAQAFVNGQAVHPAEPLSAPPARQNISSDSKSYLHAARRPLSGTPTGVR
jgi:hypothetical protein